MNSTPSRLCHKCPSFTFIYIPCPNVKVHSHKYVCAACDAFHSWAPSPETIQNHQNRQNQIDVALQNPKLSDFERRFLESVYEKRHLSPKQKAMFDKIMAVN